MMKQQISEVDGLRAQYAIGPAAGPPILLLHGVTRGWVDWTPVLSSVAARWQIFAPDARGHGGSAWVGGRYRVTDYVDDAVAYVAAHIKEPALIWGHSLGAMVAAAVAAAEPGRVRGLILEDPPYHTMGRRIGATPYAALFKGLREALRAAGTVDALAGKLADIRLPASPACGPSGGASGTTIRLGDIRDRASLRFSAACLSRLDPDVLAPLIEGVWLDGHDYQDIFARVQCPTLLLQADATAGGALSDEDAALAESLILLCARVRLRVGHQAHWLDTPGILALFHAFAESVR